MTLPVQEFLRSQHPDTALAVLNERFGVNAVEKDGLVILNYDQIASRKSCEVADDCRALTLRRGTWEVVARSFRRFYNAGERPDEAFDWPSAECQEKLDGSLCVMHNTDGAWRVQTRGSFADQPMSRAGGPTWATAFWDAFFAAGLSGMNFDPAYAYSFELCTPWNQVVVFHPTPAVHLLAAFDRDGGEMPAEGLADTGAGLPARYAFASAEAARLFVDERPGRTHEGVVARDAHGRRLKVKGQNYLHYHRLKNNGAGFAVANLVPLILAGEGDEIAAVFPEAKERVERIKERVAAEREKAERLWAEVKDIPAQKEFALAILGKTPLTAALFTARKLGGTFADGWSRCAENTLVKLLEPEFASEPF